MDPDPGGPKTCGSGGSGSGTLVVFAKALAIFVWWRTYFFAHDDYHLPQRLLRSEGGRGEAAPCDGGPAFLYQWNRLDSPPPGI
jgi:hypothetical protein